MLELGGRTRKTLSSHLGSEPIRNKGRRQNETKPSPLLPIQLTSEILSSLCGQWGILTLNSEAFLSLGCPGQHSPHRSRFCVCHTMASRFCVCHTTATIAAVAAKQKMCCLCPKSRRLRLDCSSSIFPSTFAGLILDSCPPKKYVVRGQKETELLEPHPSGARKKCPPCSPLCAPAAPS